MSLFDRILEEAEGRPDIGSRNLSKFMRNVTQQAVRTHQRLAPAQQYDAPPGGPIEAQARKSAEHTQAQQAVAKTLSPLRRGEHPSKWRFRMRRYENPFWDERRSPWY